jgi:hemoglobin
MTNTSLYQRLGGYDAIDAVCTDLIARLRADPRLARFWAHCGEDGIRREYQLLVDYLCNAAGGPVYYRGRDMKITHKGMRIDAGDWDTFIAHLNATLDKFAVPADERADVVGFVQSTRGDMVEA